MRRTVTNKQYVDNPDKCPLCGSDKQLLATSYDMLKNNTVMHCCIGCSNCGKTFKDVFELVGYKLMKGKKDEQK